MKYIGKSSANIYVLAVAVVATMLVRWLVYTPDSNFLIVSATFVAIYTILWACTSIVQLIINKNKQA